MVLIDFLLLKGLDIEPYQKKSKIGFEGDFYKTETGYKFHLYFENVYKTKYRISIYDEEKISEDSWFKDIIGIMDIEEIEKIPKTKYIPKEIYPPFNIKLFEDKKFITTPYFDFSFEGDCVDHKKGYAVVNSQCFVKREDADSKWIDEYNEKEALYIKKFIKDPESVFEKELIDEVMSSWGMVSDIRKRGTDLT